MGDDVAFCCRRVGTLPCKLKAVTARLTRAAVAARREEGVPGPSRSRHSWLSQPPWSPKNAAREYKYCTSTSSVRGQFNPKKEMLHPKDCTATRYAWLQWQASTLTCARGFAGWGHKTISRPGSDSPMTVSDVRFRRPVALGAACATRSKAPLLLLCRLRCVS